MHSLLVTTKPAPHRGNPYLHRQLSWTHHIFDAKFYDGCCVFRREHQIKLILQCELLRKKVKDM